jgi:threonine/homoserine/homoserine lactone efflux protein
VYDGVQILATLAAAQVAIAIAPGPNTLVVIEAGSRSRRLGFAAAAGVWPVGLLFATAGLTGLGTLFSAFPGIATLLRVLCGLWLLRLGIGAILRSFRAPLATHRPPVPRGLREAFLDGVLTNLGNPKSIAYYASIFVATGATDLGVAEQLIAVVMMPTISVLWYLILVVVVASPPVAAVVGRSRTWFDRIAGAVMILLGGRLLLSR